MFLLKEALQCIKHRAATFIVSYFIEFSNSVLYVLDGVLVIHNIISEFLQPSLVSSVYLYHIGEIVILVVFNLITHREVRK